MPTIPRRPAAQRERDQLQVRRLRAAELFAAGVRQAEVARRLEVSPQAVSLWHVRWRAGGPDALYSRGPSGPTARLSDAQLTIVEQALLDGATANGFVGELWILDRIAMVIERLTGGAIIRPGCGRCCTTASAGACNARSAARPSVISGDRPVGQGTLAADSANAQRRRACLVFFDETTLSLNPNVRRTWAPRGPRRCSDVEAELGAAAADAVAQPGRHGSLLPGERMHQRLMAQAPVAAASQTGRPGRTPSPPDKPRTLMLSAERHGSDSAGIRDQFLVGAERLGRGGTSPGSVRVDEGLRSSR
jgi:transposase